MLVWLAFCFAVLADCVRYVVPFTSPVSVKVMQVSFGHNGGMFINNQIISISFLFILFIYELVICPSWDYNKGFVIVIHLN